MFVAFSGIDGAGKTTLSLRVSEVLRNAGIDAKWVEKKNRIYPTEFQTRFMKAIGTALWDNSGLPTFEVTDMAWIFLHLSWYIVEGSLIEQMERDHSVVLIDDWYYKILARFLCKEGFDADWLKRLFASVKEPSMVFLLDVPPEVCWGRRGYGSASETGVHDGYRVGGPDGFLNYQSLVRTRIFDLAEGKPYWVVYRWGDEAIDTMAEKIASMIICKMDLESGVFK